MTHETLIDDLEAAGGDLIAVMERENGILTRLTGDDIDRVRGEKAALLMRFERLVGTLSANPEELDGLSDAQKETLGTLECDVRAAARRNANALQARIGVNERIVKTFVDAVRHDRENETGVYDNRGRTGRLRRPNGGAATTARHISLSLNETL